MKLMNLTVTALICVLCFAPLTSSAEEPSFEEKVEGSVPLGETNTIRNKSSELSVKMLLMQDPYLTGSVFDGPFAIEVVKEGLMVKFKKDMHRLKLKPNAAGKLEHDRTFGDQGVMPFKANNKIWKPEETFGTWSKVESKTINGLSGKGERGEDRTHRFYLKDKEGNEVAAYGTKDGDSKLCHVTNFEIWNGMIFLVDANCRDIDVWTLDGHFLFEIDIIKKTPLSYPWLLSIDITDEGVMYLGFTQERIRKSNGSRNSGVAESGFLMFTGLNTIKPEEFIAEAKEDEAK